MAECWTISDLKDKYKLSREGLAVFDFDQFVKFNKALELAQSKLEV